MHPYLREHEIRINNSVTFYALSSAIISGKQITNKHLLFYSSTQTIYPACRPAGEVLSVPESPTGSNHG